MVFWKTKVLKDTSAQKSLQQEWESKIFDLERSRDSLLAVFEWYYPEYHKLKYAWKLPSIDENTKTPSRFNYPN